MSTRTFGNGRVGEVIILTLLVFFALQFKAQSTVNTQAFFTRVTTRTVNEVPDDQAAIPKMPWVETYELRTETRDFDFDEQEYTFRLSPSTSRKRKAQTALYRHQESVPDFDRQEARCDALAQGYEDWLRLYVISRETEILNRLELVLNDRATVLNRQASSLDFEWSELISLREDQTELNLRRAGLKRLLTRLTRTYGIATSLSFDDMADLPEIRRQLEKPVFNFIDPKTDYELEQIARELELERAEQREYFDFAQIKYQGPHDDPARERFSVGVGLQLPRSGNQLIKVRELELEEAALRQKTSLEEEAESVAYQARKLALQTDFEHFDYAAETFAKEREELELIAEQLRKREGFNPLPLLKIKERELRNQLKELDLSARLYEDYLNHAERSGTLCEARKGELFLK